MTCRDLSGNGGYCLLPPPVVLGPWRAYGPADAQTAAHRNLLSWALIHRAHSFAASGAAEARSSRRRMRAASLLWRAVK